MSYIIQCQLKSLLCMKRTACFILPCSHFINFFYVSENSIIVSSILTLEYLYHTIFCVSFFLWAWWKIHQKIFKGATTFCILVYVYYICFIYLYFVNFSVFHFSHTATLIKFINAFYALPYHCYLLHLITRVIYRYLHLYLS